MILSPKVAWWRIVFHFCETFWLYISALHKIQYLHDIRLIFYVRGSIRLISTDMMVMSLTVCVHGCIRFILFMHIRIFSTLNFTKKCVTVCTQTFACMIKFIVFVHDSIGFSSMNFFCALMVKRSFENIAFLGRGNRILN